VALEQLRAYRAGESLEALGPITRLEPDGYPLLASSELAAEHERLGPLVTRLARRASAHAADISLSELADDDTEARTRTYLALIERIFANSAKLNSVTDHSFSHFFDYGAAAALMSQLLTAGVSAARVVEPTLDWFTSYRFVYYGTGPLAQVISLAQAQASEGQLTPAVRAKLVTVHGQCRDLGGYERYGEKLMAPIEALIGPGLWQVLAPCEVWTASVTAELAALPAPESQRYAELLSHCAAASSARPSDKWLKLGRAKVDAVGQEAFKRALLRWLPLVDRGRPQPMVGPSWENVDEQQRMHQENATILRGLLWLAPEVADTELTRAIGKVVLSAYRSRSYTAFSNTDDTASKIDATTIQGMARLQLAPRRR
jgi:hypothetical protein